MRVCVLVLGLFCILPAVCLADSSPRSILNSLNALRLDAQNVYTISARDRIEVRRADVTLAFESGRLAFFQPFEGRITGFIFSGLGHAIALPRDPAEKQQVARFVGAPVLDQQFVSAYVRFTDDTAQDLMSQLQRATVTASTDSSLTDLWRNQLERLNPTHSIRILVEKFSSEPRHFFHAGLDGLVTGPFDIVLDDMRPENLLIGQPRLANHKNYYDVWTSYAVPGFSPPPPSFDALQYRITTAIHPDNSLEGETAVEFRTLASNERLLVIQLARSLKVDNVALDTGEALAFFQNEGLTEEQLRSHGDDTLVVFLPTSPPKGGSFTLQFRYRGNVIANAGNGVLFVGSHDSWYPHYGDASSFAMYDMTLRWPKHLRLVATGEKAEEREDGESRVGRWKTDQPVSEAGFNLGEYALASFPSGPRTIDVYANHELEEAVLARLSRPSLRESNPAFHMSPAESSAMRAVLPPLPPPSPAAALKQLGREVDSSIRFYEKYSGPFPFRHLGISQIPGSFGQGWPGLLYISTFSFLPTEAQERAGLSLAGQQLFTDIMPFHEVAHQWWGNVVGWSSYRDQWLDEAMASYLAILFADSQKDSNHALSAWLERYRKMLATKSPLEDVAPGDVGPLTIGTRLASSKSPDGYDNVIYYKGAWVIHMLREMLRQPNSQNPDERFVALLRGLVAKYQRKALSTTQFQREIEAVMTPKMDLEGGHSLDWFFDEYVRGTGIPHYAVKFTTHRTEKGYQVKGKLLQSGVPRSFVAPVPLYAASGPGHSVLLGTVIASGEETSFSFTTQSDPHKILIDPRLTLLCVAE